MKKVKITLTVVDPRTPGMTGEAVLKALEDAGFKVLALDARYSTRVSSLAILRKEGN